MLQQNEKRHHHCALFTLKNHGVHQVYICIISFFPNQQDLQNLMDNTCFESWMSQSRTDNYSLNCTDKKTAQLRHK